jgi:hypothetical protein
MALWLQLFVLPPRINGSVCRHPLVEARATLDALPAFGSAAAPPHARSLPEIILLKVYLLKVYEEF